MTIDQGGDMCAGHRALVSLDGQGLEKAADQYFRQSEQIDTRVRLAAAEEFVAGDEGLTRAWRAGGVLVQHCPRPRPAIATSIRAMPGWYRHPRARRGLGRGARAHRHDRRDELVDRNLSPERLLFRLFHERGVRVFDAQDVREHCTCSREPHRGHHPQLLGR